MITLRESILSQMGMGANSTTLIKDMLPLRTFETFTTYLLRQCGKKFTRITFKNVDKDQVDITLFYKNLGKTSPNTMAYAAMIGAIRSGAAGYNIAPLLKSTNYTNDSISSAAGAEPCTVASGYIKDGQKQTMAISMEKRYFDDNTGLFEEVVKRLKEAGYDGDVTFQFFTPKPFNV